MSLQDTMANINTHGESFQGTECFSVCLRTHFFPVRRLLPVLIKCVKFVQWLPTIRVYKLAIVATLGDGYIGRWLHWVMATLGDGYIG